jgi:hypothetical protein
MRLLRRSHRSRRLGSIRRAACALAILAASAAPAVADVARTPPAAVATDRGGAADFDFVIGRWRVRNRVLASKPGAPPTWYEFDATSINRPIWGGQANVEDWDGASPKGRIQGFALRIYDPATRLWSIYWADQRTASLSLPPAVGAFKDGRGEFFSDGTFEGKPSRDRVTWTPISKDRCRWEQAMSLDGGKTWETSWVMEFTRAAP